MEALQKAYLVHDQDYNTDVLDNFFDHRRGHTSLLEYLTGFQLVHDEAFNRAGLRINPECKTHLLFKWSGLPGKRMSDIKLHVKATYHNLTRFTAS